MSAFDMKPPLFNALVQGDPLFGVIARTHSYEI